MGAEGRLLDQPFCYGFSHLALALALNSTLLWLRFWFYQFLTPCKVVRICKIKSKALKNKLTKNVSKDQSYCAEFHPPYLYIWVYLCIELCNAICASVYLKEVLSNMKNVYYHFRGTIMKFQRRLCHHHMCFQTGCAHFKDFCESKWTTICHTSYDADTKKSGRFVH